MSKLTQHQIIFFYFLGNEEQEINTYGKENTNIVEKSTQHQMHKLGNMTI